MTTQEYVYRVAGVEKVTDGDTFWLRLDVGFRQWTLVHCRLNDFDAPEKYRPASEWEREEADRATAFVVDFLTEGSPWGGVLWARTEKDPDNFGRWLTTVWRESQDGSHSLGELLAEQQLATRWPQRWREVYDQPR